MTANAPYSHPFRIAALAQRKPTRFDLIPSVVERSAIAAALERLEDIQEEDPLADIMLAGVADREIAAGELTDPVKTEDVQDIFAGGFDPRMAMLYSEILRPK